MKLLYVHGYNGNPYGNSFNNLKKVAGEKHEMHTIDYDSSRPVEAIEYIREYVKNNNIDCVIGASLGGFLTMNLLGVNRIAVNPCWNPAVELPIIGYTGDKVVFENLLAQLLQNIDAKEANLCSGIFASADEMLGDKYKSVFGEYFNRVYNIEGGHRISNEMAEEIINNILPNHIEAMK